MKRRECITLLGAAAGWPLAARAQQRERMRRVGVIMGFAEDDEVWQTYLATFRQRLHEFGRTERHNIQFDYRFTSESTERMRIAATEVVAMAPDVIFVTTNPVVSALKEVTRTIPIVFTWVSDSVGSGYVASFAHPGGNITGFHNYEQGAEHKFHRKLVRHLARRRQWLAGGLVSCGAPRGDRRNRASPAIAQRAQA